MGGLASPKEVSALDGMRRLGRKDQEIVFEIEGILNSAIEQRDSEPDGSYTVGLSSVGVYDSGKPISARVKQALERRAKQRGWKLEFHQRTRKGGATLLSISVERCITLTPTER